MFIEDGPAGWRRTGSCYDAKCCSAREIEVLARETSPAFFLQPICQMTGAKLRCYDGVALWLAPASPTDCG